MSADIYTKPFSNPAIRTRLRKLINVSSTEEVEAHDWNPWPASADIELWEELSVKGVLNPHYFPRLTAQVPSILILENPFA